VFTWRGDSFHIRLNLNRNGCTVHSEQRRYDMNGRFQMQGGKKQDFAEIDQCKHVLLGLSLAGNLVKPLMSLYGTEWKERGYRLREDATRAGGQ
jgi:hypothetical protein